MEPAESRHERGFTLFELLVTLIILSILLGVAMNGYARWLSRVKTEEVRDSLQRALSHARSEAIRHGGRVYLCGSENGLTCGSSLNEGWIVFLDTDGSAQANDGERVISLVRIDDDNVDIELKDANDDAAAVGISFNHRGYSNMAASITITRSPLTESFVMTRSGHVE